MLTPERTSAAAAHRLRTARVLRVQEDACEIWSGVASSSIQFAPTFPGPRIERVSPGHLVAVATDVGGLEAVVWRWYDAIVLGREHDGSVRLWEPAHGEVIAQPRAAYQHVEPGSRAWASAGLPGAEWWVAASASTGPEPADVELNEVDRLYTDNNLWSAVFSPGT
jgi:hypothetical protein